jgi:hypothetical protein
MKQSEELKKNLDNENSLIKNFNKLKEKEEEEKVID